MPESVGAMKLLELGIKAEELRQRTIASNMANIETPGYRRLDVRFEHMLAKALDPSRRLDLDACEPQLFHPDDPAMKSNGNNVSMETEIGNLVENSLRYSAYVRLLKKKYAQIEVAISERT